MSVPRPLATAAVPILLGLVLAGCAGPRVLTSLTPESGAVPAGKTLALLTPPEASGAAAGLAQARLSARGPAAGQAPDIYLQVGDSARSGTIGVMGPLATPAAAPAWIETPRRKAWIGGAKPVRTVEVAVLDAKTGAPLARAQASDRKAGDRQPLSVLVDAALARLGLIAPAT